MSRINIPLRFTDFVNKAANVIDTWFRQVTNKLNTWTDGPLFLAYPAAATQAIPGTGALTKVVLNAELYDTNSCFDSTTNYRFTPTTSGYYSITGQAFFTMPAGLFFTTVDIYVNGAVYAQGVQITSGALVYFPCVTSVVYLNGVSDYVEMFVSQNSGANQNISGGNNNYTFFTGHLVRPA